ncbi:hypothetical protein PanWU01x14_015050 [Parasponia andersonii]|uniref:Uncharacterized protein n=1 Tax=Parasponia andersonii TaxID=3476 RepID=A0A2P5E0D2_PARAD|nr:hypothetical protein PanWU01x14_015050 [Parasponia andersonii]
MIQVENINFDTQLDGQLTNCNLVWFDSFPESCTHDLTLSKDSIRSSTCIIGEDYSTVVRSKILRYATSSKKDICNLLRDAYMRPLPQLAWRPTKTSTHSTQLNPSSSHGVASASGLRANSNFELN